MQQKIPDYTPLLPLFERYLERWNSSPTATRVENVDGLAVAGGHVENYEGVTIPEFILDILREYTDELRKDPALLIDPQVGEEEYKAKLQTFLDIEKELIKEADGLKELMGSYKLGTLDPRYHITKRKLTKVVESFRLTDEDYQTHLPDLHHEETETDNTEAKG